MEQHAANPLRRWSNSVAASPSLNGPDSPDSQTALLLGAGGKGQTGRAPGRCGGPPGGLPAGGRDIM